jgi:high affinity sulfate transporter 1
MAATIEPTAPAAVKRNRLARIAPGLGTLLRYQRADLPSDLVAGLAVAAVAIPGSIANAQLAGFSPEVGLYASTLPLVAYALFGTSRQLMVGPSAATAVLVAAAVAPLAGGDAALYLSLSMVLCFCVGVLCIGASFLRLGTLADFLSKPILIGFMNGVAINILITQASRLFGLSLDGTNLATRAFEFLTRLPSTHLPTLAVGMGSMVVLLLAPRLLPRVPAPLIAMLVAGVAVHFLALDAHGVATIGVVPGGLPALHLPVVPVEMLPTLVAEAAGLALMSFSNMMIAARSFAAKNRYVIDADREIAALGATNIAAAFAQSFVVSGTNSRTAVADAAGGRTQVTGLVSAVAVAVVALFLTAPLQYVPTVVLAAVLVTAGLSLLDLAKLKMIYRIDPTEAWLSVLVTVGVVVIGAINAILLAVVLALLRFVRLASRPRVEILGTLDDQPGYHSIERNPEARARPGLLLFRFNGPIIFFSADYFKREVEKAVVDAGPDLRWFVLDMLPVNMVDATGIYTLREVFGELRSRGLVVAVAARDTEWTDWARERGFGAEIEKYRLFGSLDQAARAYGDAALAQFTPGA